MSAIEDSRNNKQLCQGSADRISNLSEELLLNILQRLTLRDAARTSILSSQWRSKWVSLPDIILDRNFFMAFLKGRQESPNILLDYMIVINDIILSHVGPILKFVLYIPRLFQIDKAISQWIRFICANKSVKKFIMWDDRGLKTNLPTCLFSFVGLTHLQLSECKLPTPSSSFRGFPCLISLNLRWLKPSDCKTNILGILVSQCPQLRELSIFSVPYIQSDLTIHAPKLQKLILMGVKLSNLHIEGIAAVKTCMILNGCEDWYRSCHSVASFRFLANVETLGFGHFGIPNLKKIRYDFIPSEWFPREFKQLKSLHLIGVRLNCSTSVSFIWRLLERCPHLEKLYLRLNVVDNEDNDVDHWPQFDGCLQYLKSVEIFSDAYKRDEFQFIKLLLAYSPVLEVMTVALSTTLEEVQAKFNLANELLQYVRASPKARIVLKTNAFRSAIKAMFRGFG